VNLFTCQTTPKRFVKHKLQYYFEIVKKFHQTISKYLRVVLCLWTCVRTKFIFATSKLS
jgi:hypothetical protein